MNPSTNTPNDPIKQATTAFIKEMSDLVQRAILETVNEALQKVSIGPSVHKLMAQASKQKLARKTAKTLPKHTIPRLTSKVHQLTVGSAKSKVIRIKESDGHFSMVLPGGKVVTRSRRRELVKIATDQGLSVE